MRVCRRHYETLDMRACQTGFNLLFSKARLSFSAVIHEISLSCPTACNIATLWQRLRSVRSYLEMEVLLFSPLCLAP